MNIIDSSDNLYYVGGCVRDEILGVKFVDVDICYEGDAVEFVTKSGMQVLKIQNDIRTARVLYNNSEIDIASTRTEFYPKEGHLPVVDKIGCPLTEDLRRRDFTVNSIAKHIKTGEIIDTTGGLDDLKNKLLRVHHKNSFKDDPTRILRGLKFSIRFGFELEPATKMLQDEYLENINYDMSYSRLKKELVDTFNLNKQEALTRFVTEGIHKLLAPDDVTLPDTNVENLLKEFPTDNPWIVYLGGFNLARLELTKEEKNILKDYSNLREITDNIDDFQLYKICKKMDLKSILIWIINGNSAQKEMGLHFLRDLKKINIETNGEDLIKLGYSGKLIGECLDKILKVKLEKPNITKDEELMIIKK